MKIWREKGMKKYFSGFGAGIVLATVCCMLFARSASKEAMTDHEIIKRATKLGMITKEMLALEKEKMQLEFAQNQEEQEEKEQKEKQQKEKEKQIEKQVQLTKEDTDTKNQKKTLVIQTGMYPNEIAKQLEKMGVIKSAKSFVQYITDHDLQTKIQIGEYHFPAHASNEQVAKQITK